MPDPRVTKLARVMVNYSLGLKPGQQFWLRTTPLAQELNLAVYTEAIKAGAPLMKITALPVREKLSRLKSTVPNDRPEDIRAAERDLVAAFDELGRQYRKEALR